MNDEKKKISELEKKLAAANEKIFWLERENFELQEKLFEKKHALRVEYPDDKHAFFNGHYYYLDKKGYYTRNETLHVAVYEYYSCSAVPKGYEIHHDGKDENGNFDKTKNDIEFLKLMERREHLIFHSNLNKARHLTCPNCGKKFLGNSKYNAVYCPEHRLEIKKISPRKT